MSQEQHSTNASVVVPKAQLPMDIVFLVDRSGSMESMGDKVVEGFNQFICEQQAAQKQSNRSVKLTTIVFDDSLSILHDRMDITKVEPCTKKMFEPRGMTALFDAVFVACQMMDINHKTSKGKVLLVILTDGQENASKEITSHHDFNKLVRKKRKQGWEFVFLAANQDAIATGNSFGFSRNACLTFGADESCCQIMMDRFSKQIQRSITVPGSQVEFSRMDRELSQGSHANILPTPTSTKNTQHIECSQLPDEEDNLDMFAHEAKRAKKSKSNTLSSPPSIP